MFGTAISRQIIKDVVGLFLPDLCLFCDARLCQAERYLCEQCWSTLPVYPDRTGMPIRPLRSVLSHLWIGWVYDDRLRRIIHLFKYQSRADLADLLVRKWIEAMPHFDKIMDADVLIPVPIHSARRRQRGFNQSEQLADCLALHCGIPTANDALLRIINTPSQTALDRGERWRSVEQAFKASVANSVAGQRLLLIDDLVTSGATLHYLAKLLHECGAESVSAAVLASPLTEGQAI